MCNRPQVCYQYSYTLFKYLVFFFPFCTFLHGMAHIICTASSFRFKEIFSFLLDHLYLTARKYLICLYIHRDALCQKTKLLEIGSSIFNNCLCILFFIPSKFESHTNVWSSIRIDHMNMNHLMCTD